MTYRIEDDASVDVRYVALQTQLKAMDAARYKLFLDRSTLFADPTRYGLPDGALDALRSADDVFAQSQHAYAKAIHAFFQYRCTCDPVVDFSLLVEKCSDAQEAFEDALSTMIPLANAAAAEYLEYGFRCFEQISDAFDCEETQLHNEARALSAYAESTRCLQRMIKALPSLPAVSDAGDYHASVGIMIFVILLCIGVSQLPNVTW